MTFGFHDLKIKDAFSSSDNAFDGRIKGRFSAFVNAFDGMIKDRMSPTSHRRSFLAEWPPGSLDEICF